MRYPIGFERMVRAAIYNFEKMGLKADNGSDRNGGKQQFDYDHREESCILYRQSICRAVLRGPKDIF